MLIFICAVTTTAYAAEVKVSLPTFDITMNGVDIEDEYRQYPLIVYKDITYFPMTYSDSRFLGLVTEWDNLTGLEIYKTTETVEYKPNKQNWENTNMYTASIPKFNIIVNGKAIKNSTEEYPILLFRNITYFPMTWRFAVDEFGWEYSFTSEDGLIINSISSTSNIPPLDNPYFKISSYMQKECINVFSPYYELLDFIISDYKEDIVDGKVEAIFNYTVINKNYDKDPDTVEYIKEAKDKGDSNYQQLYDEYLQPKDMNFHLKAIINDDGLITLYHNFSPKGIEWKEVKMSDFIISK